MTSLLAAAEEGNVDAVSELMDSSSHFDVNLANRVRLESVTFIVLHRLKVHTNALVFVVFLFCFFVSVKH